MPDGRSRLLTCIVLYRYSAIRFTLCCSRRETPESLCEHVLSSSSLCVYVLANARGKTDRSAKLTR